METKNTIIRNFASAINTVSCDLLSTACMLNESIEESKSTIATLNVIIESMRSQVVLLQQALDSYNK